MKRPYDFFIRFPPTSVGTHHDASTELHKHRGRSGRFVKRPYDFFTRLPAAFTSTRGSLAMRPARWGSFFRR